MGIVTGVVCQDANGRERLPQDSICAQAHIRSFIRFSPPLDMRVMSMAIGARGLGLGTYQRLLKS
jgi:hypothetical protein